MPSDLDRAPTAREVDVALQFETAMREALAVVTIPGKETYIRVWRDPVERPSDLFNSRLRIAHVQRKEALLKEIELAVEALESGEVYLSDLPHDLVEGLRKWFA